ncbi:MAG: RsiV family protein, partial [Gillisia sp.]|nr:RsiV family protein [Gillisia sp.]
LFTGGAHGYTSVNYLNFNSKTGDQLWTKDIFEDEFKSYAEKLFRQKNDIPENQPINSTGLFFENDSFQLPQNIGFSKNKIILRYNAYEVASYAEGGIQLEIPIKDVEEFIKIL